MEYFRADPPRACSLTEYWVNLSWSVSGVPDVGLTGVPTAQPSSGWYPLSFPADPSPTTLTFTLKAPFKSPTVTSKLEVPVDASPVYPVAAPSFASVGPGTLVAVTVSLLPSTADWRPTQYHVIQNQTGGSLRSFDWPTFVWQVGANQFGGVDVINFGYTNGCGTQVSGVRILSVP